MGSILAEGMSGKSAEELIGGKFGRTDSEQKHTISGRKKPELMP
jgi:hypothetical protein